MITLTNTPPANAITGWKANLILVAAVLITAGAIAAVDAVQPEPKQEAPVGMTIETVDDMDAIVPSYLEMRR